MEMVGVSEKKGVDGEKSGKIFPIAKKLNEIKSYWHFQPAKKKGERELREGKECFLILPADIFAASNFLLI